MSILKPMSWNILMIVFLLCPFAGHYDFLTTESINPLVLGSIFSRFDHIYKKRKDSLETQAILLILLLELEMSGVAVQTIHQNSKKWKLLLGLLSKNDFAAVLVTFCCYDNGAKVFEEVQKIATDRREYRKCSFIIC